MKKHKSKEDRIDLRAIEERRHEPVHSFEQVEKSLERQRKKEKKVKGTKF